MISFPRWSAALCRGLALLLFCGCATRKPSASSHPFAFHQDTFAYANETLWEYHIDPLTGKTTHTRRQPPPSYSLHCFVVARSARQFFQFARFDASQPKASDAVYQRLIRRVISLDPRREMAEADKIIIPGYTNLFTFSEAHAALLKSECGGAWHSYVQRGHWRMIFPFSRSHQQQTAERLLKSLQEALPPVVHVVRFPQLSINHAMVLLTGEEAGDQIQFTAYDPNDPEQPLRVIFDRAKRRFFLPPTHYFAGGRVDIYEVYCAWDY